MDNQILTPDDVVNNAKNDILLYQDTPLLTKLIKISYEDYANKLSEGETLIIAGIKGIVRDIIEPICQQNTQGSKSYLAYLEQFKQYDDGDFLKYPDAIEAIAVSLTHLLQCAVDSYRALSYPKDYDEFLDLFRAIFKNTTIINHNIYQRTVMRMIDQLRQKP